MWIKAIISLALPLVCGSVASFFTIPSIKGWYAGLAKPSFNPPNYLFGPVWMALYIMMGIALFLVWKKPGIPPVLKRTAITLFIVQLIFNFFWSIVFFNVHAIGWALLEIICMWVLILLTIVWFGRISKPAAWLLVPYIVWVSFATILNFAIWRLN